VCAATGFALAMSFVSYHPDSPAINHVGPVGYTVANLLIQMFGRAAYVFPTALLGAGAMLFGRRSATIGPVRAVGAFFALLLVATAAGLYHPHVEPEAAGGWVGGFLATLCADSLGQGGSTVLLVALGLLVFMMITGRALSDLIANAAHAVTEAWDNAVAGLRTSLRRALRQLGEWRQRLGGLTGQFARTRAGRGGRAGGESAPARTIVIPPSAPSRPPARTSEPEFEAPGEAPAAESCGSEIVIERPKREELKGKRKKGEPAAQEEFIFEMDTTNFRLPPSSLAGSHDDRNDYVDEATLVSQSRILEQKLATFGVNGRVTAVRPGPVITTFEFEPESGVKVSRVVNLTDDLTMALRAHGVRIVAPIPGKNVVGIEVSNRKRAIVGFRDLLETDEFRDARSPLTLALGRDTTGIPAYADLAKMPHLLMAGATGTGKSVALNAYILSILYKATPMDVRFIMIDPKMLELSLYEGIPHLLVPVVTDVKKASAALKNVMVEMERRFSVMKEKRVRNLDDYNRRIAEEAAERAKNPPDPDEMGEYSAYTHEHLPRIVVIVDELADMMIAVGREVEESITRLAQKARAAGIHLILATQRPSVDVITGLIKANFPSRISFKVASRPDSRTILDTVGADRLLGNGDMLYLAPGTSFLKRLHGGYIGDEETSAIVEFLKKQGNPDYRMDMLEAPDKPGGIEEDEEFFDELYDRAVDLVTQHGQGSTSWVQRKLGIGYNRAARIMEHMEREGVVGPADGAKPRQVLAQPIDPEL
jgi:S-DNA-T family DNA segregation ATPase FtsK/SpoIIIE